MNASNQAHGPGAGPNPRDRGPISLDRVPPELATANPGPTVHHVLLELQREFGGFGKDASGYGYKYVTLGKILDQIRPALINNDCVMTHVSTKLDDDWQLTTTIHHIPSDTKVSTYFVCVWAEMKGMSNPQTAGSFETYGRRYNILKLLNCSVDDDDAADVYRATINTIDKATKKETIKEALTEAKRSLPKQTWLELVEHGKLAVAVLEGGDHADPISE